MNLGGTNGDGPTWGGATRLFGALIAMRLSEKGGFDVAGYTGGVEELESLADRLGEAESAA